MSPSRKFNHMGIPTTKRFEGEIDLPHLKMTVSDHKNNPYGIQWQRYWDDAPYPELVKTIPHAAFVVENLAKEIEGEKVIIKPNSPSTGLLVAFIEINGAPVELMQYDYDPTIGTKNNNPEDDDEPLTTNNKRPSS